MHVCRTHDCAYDGVCEACNLQTRLTEAENDLQSTRHELIQVERARDSLEQQVGQLEDKVGRLELENSRLAALGEIRNY